MSIVTSRRDEKRSAAAPLHDSKAGHFRLNKHALPVQLNYLPVQSCYSAVERWSTEGSSGSRGSAFGVRYCVALFKKINGGTLWRNGTALGSTPAPGGGATAFRKTQVSTRRETARSAGCLCLSPKRRLSYLKSTWKRRVLQT